MKKLVLLPVIVLLMIPLIMSVASAGVCRYGSVHAWFQGSNGQWVNATAHPDLRLGEVFHVQIRVTLWTMCKVFFLKLHEFGTPVYEVLAGPTQIEELLEYRGKTQVQYPYVYEWTVRVRPTTSWTHASAPLEVFVQLNKDESEECVIDFDVLVASIFPGRQVNPESDQVTQHPPSDAHPGRSLSGFQGDLAFTAVAILILLVYVMQREYRKK